MPETYKGYRIRKSGKTYLRVYSPTGSGMVPRVKTVEQAKALIDASSGHRVMTPEEHALIYSR